MLMSLAVVGLLALMAVSAAAQQNQINTVVGGGPNDMPALDADIYGAYQVALDSSGNFYIAAYNQQRVFKVTPAGFLTVVAGNGLAGYSGDGVTGGAAQAMLNYPEGVAVDSNGNVYIADTDNCVIRKVTTSTNTITTVAGVQGNCGYIGDGTPATSFDVSNPAQLAVDSSNNVFIADSSNAIIRKLTVSTNTISTVAGTYGNAYAYCTNGTLATKCGFSQTPSVAVDSSDDIFLTDPSACVVYKVTNLTSKISTIAGNNALGCGYNGDNITATSAQISTQYGYGSLAVNSAGTQVWLADFYNSEVRLIAVGGKINDVAGYYGCGGYLNGIGGPATSACVDYPYGIAADSAGDLFLTQSYYYGNDVYVLEVPCSLGGTCTPPAGDTADNIYAVAGNGSSNDATPVNGVPALGVTLYYPAGVYQDSSDNIFIADTNNQFVRELLNSSGDVNAFAGDGTAGYGGDGGLATAPAAEVYYPNGVARDASGNIFFADQDNSIIREVDAAGTITTFAGTPQSPGYSGDGGAATGALLYYPTDVSVDSFGNMFIADTYNQVIREIVCSTTGTYTCTPPAGKTAGFIYTVAGNNTAGDGYSGDGGSATSAKLNYPQSAATDSDGNLYIADSYNHRIREVSAATQIINTVAGNGNPGFTGDGPALENSLYYPYAVRADANGNIFISDTSNNRMRWVDGGGTMTTFAGNGTASFSGDGGPALTAEIYNPEGFFEDASGDFLISDYENFRIRKINAFAAVGRSTGNVVFGTQPKLITSYPFEVNLSGIGPAVISSLSTTGDFSEADDCVGSLPNGTACTVSVFFTPTASGARYGTLTVNTNGYFSTATTISLEGTGTGLTITPNPLALGSTVVNTPVTKSVTVKGGTTYSSVALEGDTTDFAIATNTCTGTVASTCVVGIKFDPQSTGAKKATLVLKDSDPTSPQAVAISGTGSSYEAFTPASVTFAAAELDGTTSKATKVTFKYTGTGTLTLTALTPSSSSFIVNETGITSDACNPGTTTLTANQFCYFNAEFAPGTALGTVTGSVTATFTGDANNSSTVLPLTGTGTEVSLSPATLAFGTVTSGTKNETLTVKNVGTTTLTFNGTPTITGTGSGQFTVLGYGGGTVSNCLNGTVMLTFGQSCTFTVQFTSTGTGATYANTISVSDNGGASPQTAKITAKD
jgi:hypothetical protein